MGVKILCFDLISPTGMLIYRYNVIKSKCNRARQNLTINGEESKRAEWPELTHTNLNFLQKMHNYLPIPLHKNILMTWQMMKSNLLNPLFPLGEINDDWHSTPVNVKQCILLKLVVLARNT